MNRQELPHLGKTIYSKPVANIIFMVANLRFSYKDQVQDILASHYSYHCFSVLYWNLANTTGEEKKKYIDGEGSHHYSYIT